MGFLSGIVGGALGHGLGSLIGHGSEGASIGTTIGELLPFKHGGKVKKTGPAYLHKGEIVLPVKDVKELGRLFHTSPHHMVNARGHKVKSLSDKPKHKRKHKKK